MGLQTSSAMDVALISIMATSAVEAGGLSATTGMQRKNTCQAKSTPQATADLKPRAITSMSQISLTDAKGCTSVAPASHISSGVST